MTIHRKAGKRTAKRKTGRQFPRITGFARSLLSEWRRLQLPVSKAVVMVGVSGGADSVALLLALHELLQAGKLKTSLVVAHIDHRLRKTSAADARWVKVLGERLGYEVLTNQVDVKDLAKRTGDNLEQIARYARYESFAGLAQESGAAFVLTAHTIDDQAETVVLNLLRGSGADGLGGMKPVRALNETAEVRLARPLLSWARRRDTEDYCRERKIDFRRDEMNEDETFVRVRIRRQLLPLMESFNPRITEALARTADVLRTESDALDGAAQSLLALSSVNNMKTRQLRVDLLASAPPALRRRALRLWLEECRGDLRRLELVHVRAVENLVNENRGGRTIELPGGSSVSRKRGLLTFNKRTSVQP